jgi:hypothetical protein
MYLNIQWIRSVQSAIDVGLLPDELGPILGGGGRLLPGTSGSPTMGVEPGLGTIPVLTSELFVSDRVVWLPARASEPSATLMAAARTKLVRSLLCWWFLMR